jgi:hypothetical protein
VALESGSLDISFQSAHKLHLRNGGGFCSLLPENCYVDD